MVVRWGSTPSPLQRQLSTDCDVPDDSLNRLWRALKYGLLSVFHVTQGRAIQTCRPFITIRADHLDRGLVGNPAIPAASLLTGRSVFYGVAIEGDQDTVVAPVLGMMPGVQFHAAAFDNLLAFGSDYFHELEPNRFVDEATAHWVKVNWLEVTQMTIWGLVLSAVGMKRRNWLAHGKGLRLLLAVIVFVVATAAYLLDRSRSNWPDAAQLMFAGLYLALGGVSCLAIHLAGSRVWGHRLLILLVLGAWILLCNELLLHLSTPDSLAFVMLYLALIEILERGAERDQGEVSRPESTVPTPIEETASDVA